MTLLIENFIWNLIISGWQNRGWKSIKIARGRKRKACHFFHLGFSTAFT
jgi:hypothetical protein